MKRRANLRLLHELLVIIVIGYQLSSVYCVGLLSLSDIYAVLQDINDNLYSPASGMKQILNAQSKKNNLTNKKHTLVRLITVTTLTLISLTLL